MTDLTSRAVEYAKKDMFYKVLECAKDMTPPEFSDFFKIIGDFKDNPNYLDKMGQALEHEEMSAFLDLGSSQKMAEYLIQRAKDKELNDGDMAELKAAVL